MAARRRSRSPRRRRRRNEFDVERCLIPTVYCGKKRRMPEKNGDQLYVRRGTRSECLKKGVGAGVYSEKRKGLSANSLQQIKYVGPYYEDNFRDEGINNLRELLRECRRSSGREIGDLLDDVCRNRNGDLDKRPYNSCVLYLYRKGVYWVPNCKRISRRRV